MASTDNNTESDSKFLLVTTNNLTSVATDSLLVNPNFWIADSEATSDTKAHEVRISNKKTVSAQDNIADTSGNNVSGKLLVT